MRQSAWQALGEIGNPQVVPGLLGALRDEAWLVRRVAAQALDRILLLLERREAAKTAALLEAPPPREPWRAAARGALVVLGLGLAGLLAVALSGASKQLEAALQPLFGSQPLVVLALAVFLLAALGGLLGWGGGEFDMVSPRTLILLVALATVMLSGCGGRARPTELPAAVSQPTLTVAPMAAQSETPTSTPVAATPTPAPPVVAVATRTQTPTLSPTSTPTQTPTPLPPTSTARPPTMTPTPMPVPSDTPTPQPEALAVFPPRIALELFLTAPNEITYLTHAGDGSGRLFLVEKRGRVLIVEDGTIRQRPFLDISNLVESRASERGLLSIAFDPEYAATGEFYVNYTARAGDGDTVVARYQVTADPNVADPASAQVILQIDQPAANHNGGQLQFGPDGYLYVGMGDGGRGGDPWDNAENLNTLLGKMLRLAVRGRDTYAVPADNPFVGRADARPEIWAYGLRNPWRFSFDRATDDLYIADVGQNAWEEVDFQPADSRGGEHYGWDTLEGAHCFEPARGCDPGGTVLPVAEYGHDQGCSITGGYVYRGQRFPALWGTYFYADFCSGRIWGLRQDEGGGWRSAVLLNSPVSVASFGEDEAGELYVLDLNGRVYRLVARP